MPTDWKTPYEAALRELDPTKSNEACESARRAIVDRILELGAKLHQETMPEATAATENEELAEACRALTLHEEKVNSANR